MNPVKKIPHFFGLRIYLSSIMLYYGLVLPFILILYIKYAPKFNETPGAAARPPVLVWPGLWRFYAPAAARR